MPVYRQATYLRLALVAALAFAAFFVATQRPRAQDLPAFESLAPPVGRALCQARPGAIPRSELYRYWQLVRSHASSRELWDSMKRGTLPNLPVSFEGCRPDGQRVVVVVTRLYTDERDALMQIPRVMANVRVDGDVKPFEIVVPLWFSVGEPR